MDPRFEASLLWGLVGGMAFLALLQGYHLVTNRFLGVGPMAAGAVAVFAVTTGLAHTLRPRLIQNESS